MYKKSGHSAPSSSKQKALAKSTRPNGKEVDLKESLMALAAGFESEDEEEESSDDDIAMDEASSVDEDAIPHQKVEIDNKVCSQKEKFRILI
jgi:hypothetical protein